MKFGKYLTAAVLLAAALLAAPAARAQFYVVGDDPASIRWYSIRTDHYRIVYPAGLDSLARAYGRSLEQFQPVVGNTVGHAPAQYNRRGVPVILHSFNAISNGSVAWAPKRMDLYTSPEAYSPEPMPWIDNLTIHEQRHVSQMQVGLSPGTFRALGYVFGEMLDGAVAGIYLTSYIEGDAVVAETAFSRSGRGRTADFLNYYMIAFDNGDMRSLQRWRLGSQTRYYLDKYAFGYMQISTMRYLFGNSTFFAEYYENMARRPYDIGGFRRILRPKTGGLGERALFKVVTDTLRTMWGEEIAARAPYTPYTDVTPHERRYVDFSGATTSGGDIYAVRSGITRPAALVRISPKGNVKTLRAFASASSKLVSANDRLYWSEYAYNRWDLGTRSIIRYYDTSTRRTGTLTRRGRLFNPAASPDGTLLSAVQYLDDARSALVILDSDSGTQLASTTAPDSLQIVESAWIGDRIYVSAISHDGFGIYSIQYNIENQSNTHTDKPEYNNDTTSSNNTDKNT
ncbi:MAG: hypothetical protein LUC24_05840, partial [Bacteroidales bacterium]|nr:hypothetical protein [Bacteroidales bacterium]